MVNLKRLIVMARKWQKFAGEKRRSISFPKRSDQGKSSSVANAGHFVVYTTDKKRFEFPLEYLSSNIFVQLFNMSEEEFGLPSEGPITLPCESSFLDYVIKLVHGQISQDLHQALLLTCMSTCHSSASSSDFLQNCHQQMLIFGFS